VQCQVLIVYQVFVVSGPLTVQCHFYSRAR